MVYSEFTLEKAVRDLGISTESAQLFPELTALDPPTWLRELLARQTQLALINEKARSEFIIGPILLASRDLSHNQLAIFSGQRLDVDPIRSLTGECDFILALSPPVPPLRAPILTIVEAKKNDIEAGLGQCIAEMVAAMEFNRIEFNHIKLNHIEQGSEKPIYGCVTTGETWQFLRLSQNIALIDTQRYYLNSVGSVLGAIAQIVKEYQVQTKPQSGNDATGL